MAQKSLSSLHRIDASMVWESFIYDKNYKWLSYNLWFIYIQFYKLILKTNLREKYFIEWDNYNYNLLLIKKLKKKLFIKDNYVRFFFYIDLYCIEFFKSILLINIFSKANLKFFKITKKKNKWRKKIKKKHYLQTFNSD